VAADSFTGGASKTPAALANVVPSAIALGAPDATRSRPGPTAILMQQFGFAAGLRKLARLPVAPPCANTPCPSLWWPDIDLPKRHSSRKTGRSRSPLPATTGCSSTFPGAISTPLSASPAMDLQKFSGS
jgi:hypothetical protein